MAKRKPCPIEGCTSKSDHHYHSRASGEEYQHRERSAYCAENATMTACYSRPKPKPVPTLGKVAKVLRKLKARGVVRGAVLYVVDQVWHEEADAEARAREALELEWARSEWREP